MYPYDKRTPTDANNDDLKKHSKEIEGYIRTELSNIEGFALFDHDTRHQIDFPRAGDEYLLDGSRNEKGRHGQL